MRQDFHGASPAWPNACPDSFFQLRSNLSNEEHNLHLKETVFITQYWKEVCVILAE